MYFTFYHLLNILYAPNSILLFFIIFYVNFLKSKTPFYTDTVDNIKL